MVVKKVDVQVALAELEREKKVREFYYPKAIAEKKLTQREADKRLNALTHAIEILTSLLTDGVISIEDSKEASVAKAAKEVSLFG